METDIGTHSRCLDIELDLSKKSVLTKVIWWKDRRQGEKENETEFSNAGVGPRSLCIGLLLARTMSDAPPVKKLGADNNKVFIASAKESKDLDKKFNWVNTLAPLLGKAASHRTWYHDDFQANVAFGKKASGADTNQLLDVKESGPKGGPKTLRIFFIRSDWRRFDIMFYDMLNNRRPIANDELLDFANRIGSGYDKWKHDSEVEVYARLLKPEPSHLAPATSKLSSRTRTQNSNHVRQLTRQDFAGLQPWAAIAMTVRSAFRVAPLLGRGGDFKYWGDQSKDHCIAVEAAVLVAALASVNRHSLNLADAILPMKGAARKAGMVNRGGIPDAEDRAIWTSVAAIDGVNALCEGRLDEGNDSVVHNADYPSISAPSALTFAALGISAVRLLRESVFDDFIWLKNQGFERSKSREYFVPELFFSRPLWIKEPPGWNDILINWKIALSKLGLADIQRRHLCILEGKMNWNEIESWLMEHQPDLRN